MKEPAGTIGFPTTLESAVELGYRYTGSNRCRGCGALIHWYFTPYRKRIPIDPHPTDFVTHFATCPKREEFRR